MFNYRVSVVVIAATALSACSVSNDTLTNFGKAADQTVVLVGLPSKVTGELILENEITRNACSYLAGQKYTLASKPIAKKSQLLIDQQEVAGALEAYSKAIAGALDNKQKEEIASAGTSLSGAIGNLASEAGAPNNVGPITSILVDAILVIENNRQQAAVKAEMERVLPYLQALRKRLSEDEKLVIAEMDAQVATWEQHTKCVLNSIRGKSNAEQVFRKADHDKRALLVEQRRASKAVAALDALIDAHFAIVYGETGDFDEGLDILNKFLAGFGKIKDT